MFETLTEAPVDAILGLTERYKADPRDGKINLTVGVYKNAQEQTPVLRCVKQAEQRILAEESSKGYLGIAGSAEFSSAVQRLVFGDTSEIVTSGRAATAQAPGGTGALRVAADFIRSKLGRQRVWLSDPTWPNHPNIFQAAGLDTQSYAYFDPATNALAFDRMLSDLKSIPKGDVVVLHGCCHNPTGVDLDPNQWEQIAEVVRGRGLLPLVDFAYQGFAEGLSEDSLGVNAICRPGQEALVANSFSKNFGLYCERTGGLTVLGADAAAAQTAMGHIKSCIRANYSNPPAHGAAIVTTVLADADLRSDWEAELAEMRDRINGMRKLFVETLAAKGVAGDWSFISRQRGMFSFSGLTPEQVDALCQRHAIYVVRSGRINVAGMTPDNMDRLCEAIGDVR